MFKNVLWLVKGRLISSHIAAKRKEFNIAKKSLPLYKRKCENKVSGNVTV